MPERATEGNESVSQSVHSSRMRGEKGWHAGLDLFDGPSYGLDVLPRPGEGTTLMGR